MVRNLVRLLAAVAVLALAVAGVAQAVTPASGQYAGGQQKVQVLPGSKKMYVYLTVKYQGSRTWVTLPAAVKVNKGSFSYKGKVFFMLKGYIKSPGTGTVGGRFTTKKKLTLSFTVRKGNFKASKTATLKFVTADQA